MGNHVRLVLILCLLLAACGAEPGKQEEPCSDIWATCSDRADYPVCEDCKLVRWRIEGANYGIWEGCSSGWRSTAVIPLTCSFEAKP